MLVAMRRLPALIVVGITLTASGFATLVVLTLMEILKTHAPDPRRMLWRHSSRELFDRHPDAQIFGHRDFSEKACPSFDARTEYEAL